MPSPDLPALRATHGVLGDLLFLGQDDPSRTRGDLVARGRAVRAAAELKRELGEALASCLRRGEPLENLRRIEDRYRGAPLSPSQRIALMRAYIDHSAWSDARRVFEEGAERAPGFARITVAQEHYVHALNELGEVAACARAALAYARARAGAALAPGAPLRLDDASLQSLEGLSSDVLGGLGRAYRLIAAAAREGKIEPELRQLIEAEQPPPVRGQPCDLSRAALETSTRFYEAGFLADFGYYAGINVLYNLIELSQATLAETLAPIVEDACRRVSGPEAEGYWCRLTRLELALVQRRDVDAALLLPEVLARLDAPWKARSPARRLRVLAASREDSAGTAILAASLDDLATRSRDRLPPGPPEAAAIHARFVAAVGGEIPPSAPAPPDPARSALLRHTQSFRGAIQGLLGGNVDFGGQVPDRPLTPFTLQFCRDLVRHLGLADQDDLEPVIDRVDAWLQERLHLIDPATGERRLEPLQSPWHDRLDAYARKRLELFQAWRSRDHRTDLALSLLLGEGDCRDSGAGLALLAAVWQRDREHVHLRRAWRARREGRVAESERERAASRALARREVRLADLEVHAPIETEGLYRECVAEDGSRVACPVLRHVEDHTLPLIVDWHSSGRPTAAVLVDPWYQRKYPWKRFPLDVAQLAQVHDRPDTFLGGGTMGFPDETGNEIPVRIRFSPFSGRPLSSAPDDGGQVLVCGLEVAPAGLDHFLGQREQLDRLAGAVAGLDLAMPTSERLRLALGERLDALAARALSHRGEATAPARDDVRARGEAALPVLSLVLCLAEFRRGEDIDTVLRTMLAGEDAELESLAARFLAIGRAAAAVVRGERSTPARVPVTVPTGRETTLPGFDDFLPFRSLTRELRSLDADTLLPAVRWLLRQLQDEKVPADRAFLEHVLEHQLDAAAEATHGAWMAVKDRALADTGDPFLGWAAERVRATRDIRRLDRRALAERLGRGPETIPQAKLDALRGATPGTDVAHPYYLPYGGLLARQPDGGTRLAGQNSLPLLALGRYLLELRPADAADPARLRGVLEALVAGRDRRALLELSVLQHAVFLSARLAWGERAAPSRVPVLERADAWRVTPARRDVIRPDGPDPRDGAAVRAAALSLQEDPAC